MSEEEIKCSYCNTEPKILLRKKLPDSNQIAYYVCQCLTCNKIFILPNPDLDDWMREEILNQVVNSLKSEEFTSDILMRIIKGDKIKTEIGKNIPFKLEEFKNDENCE